MNLKPIKWKPGTVIKANGLYSDIPIEVYHSQDICAGPSVSSSTLRDMNPDLGSPAHAYAKWSGNPNRAAEEDKEHFILGRALHHLLLGEKFFARVFIKQPAELPHFKTGELRPWHGNNTECKQWVDARQKEGRSVLSPLMIEQLKQMSISVGNHPFYKTGALTDGLIECSLIWKDKETGLWCKSRPDSIPWGSATYVDLKSTVSVRDVPLIRTLRERAYYQQGALVDEGSRVVLDVVMESFNLLFVEKANPWCTRDKRLSPGALERGLRMNRAMLRNVADCITKGHWPGPGYGNEGNDVLDLSDTAQVQIDNVLKYEGMPSGGAVKK